MNRLLLCLSLLLPLPTLAVVEKARPPDACLDEPLDDEGAPARGVLEPLQLEVGGRERSLAGLELHGLRTLDEELVRRLALVPEEGPLSVEHASAVLRRLAHTGLFARVAPRVRVEEGLPAVLEVKLEENPTVTRVQLEGLSEVTPEELLEEMFQLPARAEDRETTTFRLRAGSWGVRASMDVEEECPPPVPPASLLARVDEEGHFLPGIVWGGLPAALERVVRELRHPGYVLGSLEAALSADGTLVARVDEGRVERVEVRGVDPSLAPRVRRALGIPPGQVFLRSDARRAMDRLEAELPFLEVEDVDVPLAPLPRIEEEVQADGTRTYRPSEVRTRRERRHTRLELDGWDELFERLRHRGRHMPEGITTEGKTLVVHLRPRKPEPRFAVYPLHTQVTGLTPGAAASLQVWDARDRAHLALDGGFFVPLRLGGQEVPGDAARTAIQRRAQWLVGARLQAPRLELAELGVQVHDFVDTPDRWRLGWLDSSLYSALINRPEADYFRRTGFSAFATLRPVPGLLAGVEYRRDVHGAMESMSPALSFHRRDRVFPNFAAEEGRMASLVGRLEYVSDVDGRARVGGLFRRPETPLFDAPLDWPDEVALRGFVTLEVANPALGGDARFAFWKAIGDATLYLPVAEHQGLRLRGRVAGGRHLPTQKREGLGGWNALRGYGFKELEGTASALLSTEYRWGFLGAFVDVGSVQEETSWTEPKVGVGGSMHFGDQVQLSVAWRADGRAAGPEARLLFQRTF